MTRINDDRLLNFGFGLTGVRRATDVPRLPDEGMAPAQDTRPVVHLDALFDRPGIEDALDSASAPEIGNPNVLEPSVFTAALDDARGMMLDLAANRSGPDGAVFAEALAVLEDAQADRSILDTARRALMRG